MFLRHIIGTIGVRVASAAISVLLLLLHARYLEDTGLGTIALIVLGVNLSSLFAHVLGGGVLVYFASRAEAKKLLYIAYIWSVISIAFATILLILLGLIPEGYEWAVWGVAMLEVAAYNHHSILIGQERIPEANACFLLRMLLLGGGVAIGILWLNILTPWVYVYAILIANGLWLLGTIWVLRKTLFGKGEWILDNVLLKKMLKLGIFSQSGNAMQLMNYRLDIYLLESFFPVRGLSMIGQYSAANQMGESIWIIPRAIASVQYGRISNSDDASYSRRLSLRLMALCMALATVGVVILLMIPSEGFVWLLGERFRETGTTLAYLAPGILFLSGSIPLSPYFSGRGLHAINAWAAAAGLLATLCVGLWLIPNLGVSGAAITSSVSYGVTWGAQLGVLVFGKRMKNE